MAIKLKWQQTVPGRWTCETPHGLIGSVTETNKLFTPAQLAVASPTPLPFRGSYEMLDGSLSWQFNTSHKAATDWVVRELGAAEDRIKVLKARYEQNRDESNWEAGLLDPRLGETV